MENPIKQLIEIVRGVPESADNPSNRGIGAPQPAPGSPAWQALHPGETAPPLPRLRDPITIRGLAGKVLEVCQQGTELVGNELSNGQRKISKQGK